MVFHLFDSIEKSQKLVKVCIKETKKITHVLKELENIVISSDIKTTNYVKILKELFENKIASGSIQFFIISNYHIHTLVKRPRLLQLIRCHGSIRSPTICRHQLRRYLSRINKILRYRQRSKGRQFPGRIFADSDAGALVHISTNIHRKLGFFGSPAKPVQYRIALG